MLDSVRITCREDNPQWLGQHYSSLYGFRPHATTKRKLEHITFQGAHLWHIAEFSFIRCRIWCTFLMFAYIVFYSHLWHFKPWYFFPSHLCSWQLCQAGGALLPSLQRGSIKMCMSVYKGPLRERKTGKASIMFKLEPRKFISGLKCFLATKCYAAIR